MECKLTIPEWIQILLKKIAKQSLPEECCGLLYGNILTLDVAEEQGECLTHFVALDLLTVPNMAEDKVKCFVLAPSHIPVLEMVVEAKGLEVVAIYHSHPTTVLEPSKTDIMFNFNHTIPMLIINDQKLRGWIAMDGGEELKELTVVV